jgi:hypothetical protein
MHHLTWQTQTAGVHAPFVRVAMIVRSITGVSSSTDLDEGLSVGMTTG